MDVKKFEMFIKSKGQRKRLKDVSFILNKSKYHREKFVSLYHEDLSKIRKQQSEWAVNQIKDKDIPELKFDGTNETKCTMTFSVELSTPAFYEFDAFMNDVKRTIEYLIKLVAHLVDQEEPKSIENFFDGFKKDPKDQSNLCKFFIEHFNLAIEVYPENSVAVYFNNEWDEWIKQVNKYRTDSMHNSIPNQLSGKVDVFWGCSTSKESPTNVHLDGFKIENIEVREYTRFIEQKLSSFCDLTVSFLERHIANSSDSH